jgi:hypothetical protein
VNHCPTAPRQRWAVSRLTIRTKIALCAGLLAVAAGVAVAFRSPAKPAVEIKFVRYVEDGGAVLAVTNRGKSALLVWRAFHGSNSASCALEAEPELGPFQGMNIVAHPPLPAPTISVQYSPMPSTWRMLAEAVASKVGFSVISTGFVVTVTLPPRETNAPAQPVTP